MKYFTRIAVLCYVTIVMFLSCFILLFALNWLNFYDVMDVFYLFYIDANLKMMGLVMSGVLLIMNFTYYKIFSVNVHREKIIAFNNPAGQVSVSLFAMQDLVKRLILSMSEVKDAKPTITISKKGLHVRIRLSLRREINIPELTSKIQDQVKRKIQGSIGMDDPIEVSVYVGKILPEKIVAKRKKEEKPVEEKKADPNVPFSGYRA